MGQHRQHDSASCTHVVHPVLQLAHIQRMNNGPRRRNAIEPCSAGCDTVLAITYNKHTRTLSPVAANAQSVRVQMRLLHCDPSFHMKSRVSMQKHLKRSLRSAASAFGAFAYYVNRTYSNAVLALNQFRWLGDYVKLSFVCISNRP